jgi:limonene-1,2-epoxide hydrolase
MLRLSGFLLLLSIFAVLLAACRGDDSPSADPAELVAGWSQAVTGGDDEEAMGFFAPGAIVIQDDRRTTLDDEAAAFAFNSSLPCGYKVVEQKVSGDQSTATLTLTRRPDHMCDGTGETVTVMFRITDGKIVLWHQLPPDDTDQQAA